MALDELLQGFPVVVTVPVAWGDMDAFQHVNNTRFFRYFEDARIAYFERTGVTDLSGTSGIGPILAHTAARFRAPITYPDDIQVGARVLGVGQHSFKMEYKVVSVAMHKVAATGTAVIVAYDYVEGRKSLLPDAWRRALGRVENCDFAPVGDEELDKT
ncbi:MAG: acyl-CoA thioesterase [Deltaproteobacteria bacterium]|jgi:acyl-CoA thioester hydrolase|nr:acyl-CoA thioesterase [Deltaproteobacteria bacterium]